jgi:hypothetical protein
VPIEFERWPERTFQGFLDLVPAAPWRRNQGEEPTHRGTLPRVAFSTRYLRMPSFVMTPL